MKAINLLKQLTKVPAVSGFERELGASKLLASFFPFLNPKIDELGNVIIKVGQGKKKILIEAHMDEVGVIKTKNGFVKIGSIRDDNIRIKDVELSAKIKDIGYFKRRFKKEGFMIRSPALDNKVGCTALIMAIEEFNEMQSSVYFVFTVQEETTKKGIKEIVKKLQPNIIVSIDSAYAQPYKNDRWEIPVCGKGPAIQKQGEGFIINNSEVKLVEKIAKKENIPYQFEVVDSDKGGTNLSYLETGARALQINIPVRSQHTALSEANLKDIKNTSKLITKIIEELD